MSKYIKAKFDSKCAQTGASIKRGDEIYYIPGRGSFCSISAVYQDKKANPEAAHVQAQEEAYFDNFCQTNNI